MSNRPAAIDQDFIDELRNLGANFFRAGNHTATSAPERFDAEEAKHWLAGYYAAKRHG